ncbi:MAG: ferrous iron transport protein A [Clostridia bacterium]|nr:ferrous iron transport protein A [Clostridia bacterium]
MIPLLFATPGTENVVKKIGGSPEIVQHLKDMGFVAGASVTVVNSLAGNIIVSVKGTRVAIGQDLARRIMIC